jgi:flagellar hook-length control protein FliK
LAQLSQSHALPPPMSARVDNTAAISPVLPQLTTPVQDTAWGDRLGDRLMMMADNKLQFAEIRLTPAELGPLRIQVSIDDGAASVTFHAQHIVTREALEQAMPRLRELFADNGLTLAESRVSDAGEQGVSQGNPEQRDRADEAAALLSDGETGVTPESAADRFRPRPRADQLLDTFA